MTRGELLDFLTREAKKYRREALSSIERNQHMNDLSRDDFLKFKRGRQRTQRLIDALLVDFINVIGVCQCLNYGLYAKDIKSKQSLVAAHKFVRFFSYFISRGTFYISSHYHTDRGRCGQHLLCRLNFDRWNFY